MRPSILILGGTGEARRLAAALAAAGIPAITSLAGVTAAPQLPDGPVRFGGFGGPDGLAAFLQDSHIALLVDATHPFAAQMSRHAALASTAAGLPLLRLERLAWQPQAGDAWIGVPDVAAAAAALPPGARALVTIGRKEFARFAARDDVCGIVRMIEAPAVPLPPNWHLLLHRPPFAVAAERDILRQHRITHLVTKNAGSDDTSSKLVAARDLRISVIMVARPQKPAAETFSTAEATVRRVRELLSP